MFATLVGGMPSFQTVRLARGRHERATDGVCAAELASMIAGERFSDHPKAGCPAITAFLRGYNDGLPDSLRQDLFGVSAALVGSRADEAETTRRGDALVALAWRYERRVLGIGCLPVVNFPTRFQRYEGAGWHLGRCARRQPDCHAEVLATLEELLSVAPPGHAVAAEAPAVLV